MQFHPATVPFFSRAQVPNFPGMTPVTAHVDVVRSDATVRAADRSLGVAAGAAGLRTVPTTAQNVLEYVEDAGLLLLIVFMVPALIMLLALPFALVLRIADEIGRRL